MNENNDKLTKEERLAITIAELCNLGIKHEYIKNVDAALIMLTEVAFVFAITKYGLNNERKAIERVKHIETETFKKFNTMIETTSTKSLLKKTFTNNVNDNS